MSKQVSALLPLLTVGLVLGIASCGGGGGSVDSPAPTPTITTVSVSCSPSSIQTGQTSQCTATVTGTGSYSSTVTWSASAGTINSSGLLTSPSTAGNVTVTATSTQDTTKSGTATVTVTVPVTITSVTVSCNPSSIQTGQTSQCTATVTGTGSYSSGVTWAAIAGTINASGLFTAPNSAGDVTVTATSKQDTTKSGTATVTVSVPATITGVSITPTSATVNTGATRQFSATVSGTGNYNSTVSWCVCDSNGANCANGGNSSYGTVSTTGLYNAPITQVGGQGLAVTVEAVANGNSSESATATVTVTVPAFSNASLNGRYAFSLKDPQSSVFVAGSFVADGNGNVTQGILDFISDQNSADILSSGSLPDFGTGITFTGRYQIGTDGRGTINLVSPQLNNYLPDSYDLVMISTDEGRLVAADVVYVAGAMFNQDTSAFSNAAVAGNYAFGCDGIEPLNFSGSAAMTWPTMGSFTLDGQGNVLSGTIYIEGSGSQPGFSGTYNIGPNGRGTITFTFKAEFNSYSYFSYVYVVSPSRMILIAPGAPNMGCTTNCSIINWIGEADQQVGLPFSNASFSGDYTFYLTGRDGWSPVVAGQFVADGQSTITGEANSTDDSFASLSEVALGGTFSVSSNGFGTSPVGAFFLVSPSQGFVVSTASGPAGDAVSAGGAMHGQSGPLAVAGNYAFSFLGSCPEPPPPGSLDTWYAGEVTASGQFTANGAGAINGTVDFGSVGTSGQVTGQLTGTYSNIDSTGRGTMSVTTQVGGSPYTFTFAFYATSPSEFTRIGQNADVLGSATRQQ